MVISGRLLLNGFKIEIRNILYGVEIPLMPSEHTSLPERHSSMRTVSDFSLPADREAVPVQTSIPLATHHW